jgi:hypothetical protein
MVRASIRGVGRAHTTATLLRVIVQKQRGSNKEEKKDNNEGYKRRHKMI